MLQSFVTGALTLMQPLVLVSIFFGILIGIVVGILPGIGPLVTFALCLPYVYGMQPEVALGFMVALASVVSTAGPITAALLNVPGETSSAAAMQDSFPMTKRGEAGRAIGAAVFSSMVGGVLPAFLAMAMIPILIPAVLLFKSPEKCVMVLLGLSFLATLASGSVYKGLIAGMFGILLASVGMQDQTGTARFTFGTVFLHPGLNITGVALGMFGITEMMEMYFEGETSIAQGTMDGKISGIGQGIRDVFHYKWLCIRSSVIAFLIGLIPGIGAAVVAWISYGHAKMTSKHPEEFGKGSIEGVIAPEAADNAKESAALLTTFAFGIPGNVSCALLLGAFVLLGVTPGPDMLTTKLPLTFTLLLGVALSNIIGGIICLVWSKQLCRIAFVHADYTIPAVIVLIFVGAYVGGDNDILNVLAAIIFGLLGFCMKRLDYPRAPLILGFILGELFEYYLSISLKTKGPWFFMTPISLFMIAIIIVLYSYPLLRAIRRRRRT